MRLVSLGHVQAGHRAVHSVLGFPLQGGTATS